MLFVAADTLGRMFDVSVVYILRPQPPGEEVLLGEKLTGFGAGKIVGPGGKHEQGETALQCAVREVREEVGIILEPDHLVPLARISYPFIGRPQLSQRSHVFMVRQWEGEPVATSEIRPTWWPVDSLPLEGMWSDVKLWLPRALAGEFLEATLEIGPRDDVLSHDMVWSSQSLA